MISYDFLLGSLLVISLQVWKNSKDVSTSTQAWQWDKLVGVCFTVRMRSICWLVERVFELAIPSDSMSLIRMLPGYKASACSTRSRGHWRRDMPLLVTSNWKNSKGKGPNPATPWMRHQDLQGEGECLEVYCLLVRGGVRLTLMKQMWTAIPSLGGFLTHPSQECFAWVRSDPVLSSLARMEALIFIGTCPWSGEEKQTSMFSAPCLWSSHILHKDKEIKETEIIKQTLGSWQLFESWKAVLRQYSLLPW